MEHWCIDHQKVAVLIPKAGPILVALKYLRKNVQPLPCKRLRLHVAGGPCKIKWHNFLSPVRNVEAGSSISTYSCQVN